LAFIYPFVKSVVGSYKDGGMATNKGTAIPVQARTGPEDSRKLRLPDIKVVRLSAVSNDRLYNPTHPPSQEIFLVLISIKRLSRPQSHSGAGRGMATNKGTNSICLVVILLTRDML